MRHCQVQQVHSDGALALHTRSLKYGKLGQGVLVKVSPSLVKRRKSHFHSLPCGCSIILGNNGYVWIYPTVIKAEIFWLGELAAVWLGYLFRPEYCSTFPPPN